MLVEIVGYILIHFSTLIDTLRLGSNSTNNLLLIKEVQSISFIETQPLDFIIVIASIWIKKMLLTV